MIIGDRIIAPDGYRCLKKDVGYFFLKNNYLLNIVRLVEFVEYESEISSTLVTLTSDDFELGLKSGFLVAQESKDSFPFWLEAIRGLDFDYLERIRHNPLESYSKKVIRRFGVISELLMREEEILGAKNPDAIINAYAGTLKPTQNFKRVRTWFYTYLVFGRNRWALLPRFHNIGTWDRGECSKKKKLGRPPKSGKRAGYSVDPEMKEKILDGFMDYKGEKIWWKIYNKVLVNVFGCKPRKSIGAATHFYHPEGHAFPTQNQFIYWVKKFTDSRKVSIDLRGRNRTRSESGSVGSFSENLTNLNQKVEFDGYYYAEKLSGITEKSVVDGFCVVRAACALSGAIVGIGFAKDREKREAYRMALFSMAVPKIKYAELFGLDIEEDEWPCRGLAANIVFDRGPGAGMDVEAESAWLASFELTPTNSGQSKATVESSHPKKAKETELPSYFHSAHNFVRMAKRHIYEVLIDNQSSDASYRMTDNMWLENFTPTPNNIWLYLDARARNSGLSMPFDEAVRTFLSKYSASVKIDGVYFFKRRYSSPELVSTGIYDRVAKEGQINVQAYVMNMCVRHIWIEVGGKIFELSYHASVSVPSGSADISLYDLIELDSVRRQAQSMGRDEKLAVQQYYRDQFKQNTGADWDSGVRKPGKNKKDSATKRDTDDYKRFMG